MSYTKEKELMDEGNISDKEFQEKYLPFYDNFKEYMIRYVIPDAVAFYIANSYSRGCLDDSKLYNHINSAVDIFNCRCNIDVILPSIEIILNIKYNLKITDRNPLKLEKYYSNNCNIKLDIKIFFKTFSAVTGGHGAGV